jgi:hypothetical protein
MEFSTASERRRAWYAKLASLAENNAAKAAEPEARAAWLRLVRSWTARAKSERLN